MRLASLAMVVAILRPAYADRSAADRLADEAVALAGQNKPAEAAAKFRAAYAEDPRPQLICNVGVAYYKANDLARAAFYLDRCRTVGGQLDPAFLDNVDKVIAAVRGVLSAGNYASVTVTVDPPTAVATIEGAPFDEPIVAGRSVWLPFGSYRVHAHQDGYVDRDTPVNAGDRTPVTVHVQLDRVARPAEPPISARPQPPVTVDHPAKPVPAPAPEPTRSHAVAIAVSLGAVTIGVLAGVSYLHATSLNDQAARTTDYMTWKGLHDSTLTYEHLSWAGAGVAGLAAVAGGYLWYRGLHVEASPTAAVAVVSGRF